MFIPVILAHGALGIWDEVIFLGVAAIFLSMMAISWLKNRNSQPPLDTPTEVVHSDEPAESGADRFRLD